MEMNQVSWSNLIGDRNLIFSIPSKYLFPLKQNKQRFVEIIRFSFPLYINSLLTFLRERVNIFLIGIMMNPVSVALYDVATKVPLGLIRIFQSFIHWFQCYWSPFNIIRSINRNFFNNIFISSPRFV